MKIKLLIAVVIVFAISTGIMLTSLGERKEPQDRCAQKISIDSHKEYAHIKKWPPKCPQSDVVDPGVGNFVINGVRFDIPRKFLFRRPESDGPSTEVELNFVYPDMRDYTAAPGEKKYNISVYVNAFNNEEGSRDICSYINPDWCYPAILRPYIHRVYAMAKNEKEYLAALPKPDEVSYNEEL